MNKEELNLLEIVFILALGECAYNDINNIRKLEDKIKTINNLCKKQKEVIDEARLCIKDFLCSEEYINVDGDAIANNYKNILNILKGERNG